MVRRKRLLINEQRISFLEACRGKEKISGLEICAQNPDVIPVGSVYVVGGILEKDGFVKSFKDIKYRACERLFSLTPKGQQLLDFWEEINKD